MSPPQFDRITDYVSYWAQRHPQREALASPSQRISYAQLEEEVDRLAASLLGAGVRRGDRVAMYGPSKPVSYITFLAAASVGAIWVGLNPRYTLEEVERVIDHSEPHLIFVTLDPAEPWVAGRLAELRKVTRAPIVVDPDSPSGLRDQLDATVELDVRVVQADLDRARQAVQRRDAAAMVYTSGSTGKAKGALVPHGGLVSCGVVQSSHWYETPPRELCDVPLNHIGGLGDICTSVLTAGGAVYFMERFNASEALRAIEQERLTHVYWVPTQLLAATEAPEWESCDLSSLQWVLWGGAAAPASLLEKVRVKVDAKLGTSYGMTESTGSVSYTAADDPTSVLSWSVGKVDPHYDLRIDGDGEGEVLIRGEFITLGYFKDDEATRAAIDADGWLHTGDIAQRSDDGNLRLVGRSKEMYKSGGYNVYPREVEMVLERHPAVTLAAVVGVADERWGEVGRAYLTVNADVSGEDLEHFARARLANYKIPKSFSIVEALPKLPVGKVDKNKLRRWADHE